MSDYSQDDIRIDEQSGGTVSFATDVIATIAALAANEVEGVASMSSQKSGFADMFSSKNTKNLTKGVKVELVDNAVVIEFAIVVEYGFPIPEITRNLQEGVRKAIDTMTGLEVKAINIRVTGISFEREQRAAAELDEQQKKFLNNADSDNEPSQEETETAEPEEEQHEAETEEE